MPIAVLTGATGFVGSHLADYLLQQGYEVRCIVRKSSNLRWLAAKNVKLYELELNNPTALETVLHQADYLFHVAGTVRSLSQQAYYEGNVAVTNTVLTAASRYGHQLKKIVVISSLAAVGPAQLDQPLTENCTPQPISWYGQSKWQQEQLCHQFAQQLPITIIRPPAVYGARETDIFLFFQAAQKGIMLQAGLIGNKQLSIVHIDDLIAGISLAATQPQSTNETFFMGYPTYYTWADMQHYTELAFAQKIWHIRLPNWALQVAAHGATYWSQQTGKTTILSLDKVKELTADAWICTSQKAIDLLGYQPSIPLSVGIAKTIAWYKKEGWLSTN